MLDFVGFNVENYLQSLKKEIHLTLPSYCMSGELAAEEITRSGDIFCVRLVSLWFNATRQVTSLTLQSMQCPCGARYWADEILDHIAIISHHIACALQRYHLRYPAGYGFHAFHRGA